MGASNISVFYLVRRLPVMNIVVVLLSLELPINSNSRRELLLTPRTNVCIVSSVRRTSDAERFVDTITHNDVFVSIARVCMQHRYKGIFKYHFTHTENEKTQLTVVANTHYTYTNHTQ